MPLQEKLSAILSTTRSGYSLGIFRILFIGIVLFHYIKLFDRIEIYKAADAIRFPYPELEWIPLFSYEVLIGIAILGVAACLLSLIGVFYRKAMVVATLSFAYLNALDALYYNNHYYLLVLLCFLMCFVEADKAWSWQSMKNGMKQVSYWNYLILQLQIVIVFLYGGIAKLSSDWLGGHALGLVEKGSFKMLFLTWGGMFFDLFIGLLLLYRPTRFLAIILVLVFNVSNHFLFDDIAAFPLLAVASMVLFLEGSSFPSWIKRKSIKGTETANGKISPFVKWTLCAYFLFQLTYPLRHHFIEGDVDWTGQGHYFAWRMKSYQKDVSHDFYAYDRSAKKALYKINTGMDNYRIQRVGAMPHMMIPLALQLKHQLTKIDGPDNNIGIAVDYKVSYNDRRKMQAVGPHVDLTKVQFNRYSINDWIQPCPSR